jgi:hypothetical protein
MLHRILFSDISSSPLTTDVELHANHMHVEAGLAGSSFHAAQSSDASTTHRDRAVCEADRLEWSWGVGGLGQHCMQLPREMRDRLRATAGSRPLLQASSGCIQCAKLVVYADPHQLLERV